MSPPAPRRSHPRTRPASARAVALEVVRRVIDEGAYSNRLLPALLASSGLDQRDRAFAAELAYGTLRRRIPLDRAIGERSTRPVDRITPGAAHALRLGAYQLLVTGTPAHAAVGETVGLVDARERGFVNAVLRRIAEDPPAPPVGRDDAGVSARTGMAPWAVRELRRLLDAEEVEAAAEAFAARGPLTLRVNPCRSDLASLEAALRDEGHEVSVGAVDEGCLLLDGGDPARLPGFREGWFAVQDQASAYVVRTLDPGAGERVLDVCAAPGGKVLAAACLVGDDGLVVAADVRPGRIAPVAREAARLGVRPALLVQDATAPAVRGPFDRVLVDAPCSGVGSARRRPELLWRVPKDDLSRLARRQVAIASAAAALLRPGGRLVYSVCTFPRAETDAACDALLRHRPELRPVRTPGPDGDVERHRLWPHRHGSDGMFVAAFERA
ncbi:MAG: transcription antitermination factor NusB [Planctomycetaceae bacterium]